MKSAFKVKRPSALAGSGGRSAASPVKRGDAALVVAAATPSNAINTYLFIFFSSSPNTGGFNDQHGEGRTQGPRHKGSRLIRFARQLIARDHSINPDILQSAEQPETLRPIEMMAALASQLIGVSLPGRARSGLGRLQIKASAANAIGCAPPNLPIAEPSLRGTSTRFSAGLRLSERDSCRSIRRALAVSPDPRSPECGPCCRESTFG